MANLEDIWGDGSKRLVDPPEVQLKNAIIDAGLEPPSEIILDGKIHRFRSGSKGRGGYGDKSGCGDEVIKHTAEVTKGNLRQSDTSGRYGGEEFGIILPETDAEGARTICERIRESIAQSVVETSVAPVQYTISMGIAQLSDGPENYMQWMQLADEALYAAKEGGRNRVMISEK